MKSSAALRFTRAAVRRSGDDYQDLVALELMIDFLADGRKFRWIEVEADEVGSLDDVVAVDGQGRIVAKQVKYSVHANEGEMPWGWNELLDTPKPNSRSLLHKWSQSYSKLRKRGKLLDVSLVTNRPPDESFANILSSSGRVVWQRIDAETKRAVLKQLGSSQAAIAFFGHFRFCFRQPTLEDLNTRLKRKFFQLGCDEIGWLNLKEELRSWIREARARSGDEQITLGRIRAAARWYELQALSQDYLIPRDYVVPSEQFHERVLNSLLSGNGCCFVLEGSPGLGKSTYLSYLYRELERRNAPVIRHHYFLSGARSIGRYSFQTVAESLMENMKRQWPAAIGSLEVTKPNANQLSEWITAVANYAGTHEQKLVIIIDGLDHVWREQGSTEDLNRLFEHLLPVPKNAVIILGTQPVDEQQLPSGLLEHAPRADWRKLMPLTLAATTKWLGKHAGELALVRNKPNRAIQLRELANAFYRRSQGHPLHLRYSLLALQEQNLLITEENVLRLPGCSHQNITTYYQQLWTRLPRESKSVLCLMATYRFPWPQSEIARCLDPNGSNIATTTDAIAKVRHLLINDTLGLRAFHGSLLVFIESQGEHRSYIRRYRELVRNWLQNDAPIYWKWANEWIVDADLGNTTRLIQGPTREWVVHALERGRQGNDVGAILAQSAWAAIKAGDLGRSIEIGLLRDYYYAGISDKEDARTQLLYSQLRSIDAFELRHWLHADLKSLRLEDVTLLAEYEEEHGNQERVKACLIELQMRLNSIDTEISGVHQSRWRQALRQFVRVAALFDGTKQAVIMSYAQRSSGIDFDLTRAYGQQLRKARRVTSFETLMALPINAEQKRKLLDDATLLAFDLGVDLPSSCKRSRVTSMYVMLYRALREKKKLSIQRLSPPDVTPLSILPYKLYERRSELRQLFQDSFVYAFAAHVVGEDRELEKWLRQVDSYTWSRQCIQQVVTMARTSADQSNAGNYQAFSWLYEALLQFPRPELPEQRDDFECSREAARAVQNLCFDVYLMGVNEQGRQITPRDLDIMAKSAYWDLWEWLDTYLERSRTWLTSDAVQYLLEYASQRLESVYEFTERANGFAALARLATMHGMQERATHLLRSSAENILSYGHHKDYLLFSALECLEACHGARIEGSSDLLRELAAPISRVGEFTDGDETGALPRDLGETVNKIEPGLLGAYHNWLCKEAEYYDAESVFHTYLKGANLVQLQDTTLAGTICSPEGIGILIKKERSGIPGAKKALEDIAQWLGREAIREPEKDHETPSPSYSDERTVTISQYPPQRFAQYAEAIRSAIRSDERCTEWIKYWAKKGKGTEVIAEVEKEIKRGISFRVYDALFDVKLRTRGKNAAFPSLVKAHTERYGWGRYFYSKEEAIKRWKVVRQHYPDRWYQFVVDTMGAEGEVPWEGFSVQDRVARLVEYLIFMKQPQLAADITRRITRTIVELVSPLRLPVPPWINEPSSDSSVHIELMLARLAWPSGMVREHTCVGLSKLLVTPQTKALVKARLIEWISRQTLESLACNGLLVWVHAQGVLKVNVTTADEQELQAANAFPSVLSWVLMKYLNKRVPDPDWRQLNSGTAPLNHVAKASFRKYLRILPAGYVMDAERITRNNGIDFFRQWEYEWQRLLERCQAEPGSKGAGFWGREDNEHYIVYDTESSEIYRSAFLRALAWGAMIGALSPDDIGFLAARSCPIDVGVWKVKPALRPKEWPRAADSPGPVDTTAVEIWRVVERLWESQKQKKWVLSHTSGRVHSGTVHYDLNIYGILQSCQGAKAPRTEDIIEWLRDDIPLIWMKESGIELKNGIVSPPVNRLHRRLEHWNMVPLSAPIGTSAVPRWVFWRMFRGMWGPVDILNQGSLAIACRTKSIHFTQKRKAVARWNDWTEGLSEKITANLSPATGERLLIKRELIRQAERKEKKVFMWVCELTGYSRDDRFGAFKVFRDYRTYGERRVVEV